MKQNKAYWIQKTHLFDSDEYICSACRYSAPKPANVCPNCGSIMEKCKYDPNWVDEFEMMDSILED